MKTNTDGQIELGKQIVVIKSGFVHVGKCTLTGPVHGHAGFLVIEECKNIRNYGTTRGIGQLASGPTNETKADDMGYVLVPYSKVIFFVKVTGGW